MFLTIYFSVFALNMLTIQSQDVCDCKLLKGIIQKIMWEQKLESTKLEELEQWKMSNQVSPGTANKDLVERLENMEKKLEKLMEKEDEKDGDINVMFRKTVKSEKLERLKFMNTVKSQMTNIKVTMDDFKTEINETVGKVIADINASLEGVKKDIDEKMAEVKEESERFTDAIVMNITDAMNENIKDLTQFNKSLSETRKDIEAIERIAVNEKVDGKWSDWGRWSGCSVSCGSGSRYRVRSCSSPPPSELGKQCEGNSRQTDSCGEDKCREPKVAFHAYGISARSKYSDLPSFPNIVTNIGNDYNSETGIFICEVPGIYSFSVTLSIKDTMTSTVHCYLQTNFKTILEIYVRPRGGGSSDLYPASSSGVLYLSKGDTVYIGSCGADERNGIYDDESTNFAGFLIVADGLP